MSESSWSIAVVGPLPFWAALPIALLAASALALYHRKELQHLEPLPRRMLLLLRATTAAFLALALVQPSLRIQRQETLRPRLALLLDSSASMGVRDLKEDPTLWMDEAKTMNRITEAERNTDTHRWCKAFVQLKELHRKGFGEEDKALLKWWKEHRDMSQPKESHGLGPLLPFFKDVESWSEAEDQERPNLRRSIAQHLSQLMPDLADLLKEAQKKSDEAWIQKAGEGPLSELVDYSRLERARMMLKENWLPLISDQVRLETYHLDEELSSLEWDRPIQAQGATHFVESLDRLLSMEGQDPLSGLVIVSDGRSSVGGDPMEAMEHLLHQKTAVLGIGMGSDEKLKDAAIGDLEGSDEIFEGENVILRARTRMLGLPEGRPWVIIVEDEGGEILREQITSTQEWKQQRLTLPPQSPGLHEVTFRLEPLVEEEKAVLVMERWNRIKSLDHLRRHKHFPSKPDKKEELSTLSHQQLKGDDFALRARGTLEAPVEGEYTFHISSDDASELRIRRMGQSPVLVAGVRGYVGKNRWEDFTSQSSDPMHLAKGERVEFEMLYHQARGEAHWSIGWTRPDEQEEKPIAPNHLKDALAPSLDDHGPEITLDNNIAQTTFIVHEDPVKILLLDHHPRWESRYLSTLFDRDRRVDLERRFRTVQLQQKDQRFFPETKEELFRYDGVVLGDIRPTEFVGEQQRWLEEYVAERGGLLVLLAGPRGLPGKYSLGPIANLIPVKNSSLDSREEGPHRVRLTQQGREHAMMRVLEDEERNLKLWPLLPQLPWIATPTHPKGGTTVLLESHKGTPVVAQARHGAGRVFYIGSDQTWRWRDRLGDRVHRVFWEQVLRWGLENRLRGEMDRLQVSLERYVIREGGAGRIRVRALDEDGNTISETLELTVEELDQNGDPRSDSMRKLALVSSGEGDEILHHESRKLPVGRHRLTVSSTHPSLLDQKEIRDIVVQEIADVEMNDIRPDFGSFSRWLRHAQGEFTEALNSTRTLEDFVDGLEERKVERVRLYSLWDSAFFLLLVSVLLFTEWVIRTRRGLP